MARLVAVGAALLAWTSPLAAWAQPESTRDPIAAETLFTRGKQLVDQGRVAEACAAFAESQRLDPAGGTLLRLALCHEAQGKLASAWLEFTEVVRVSKESAGEPAKLAERVRIANEHLAAIQPKLPRLVVLVPDSSRVAGLQVTANGLPRNSGIWGVPVPIDPGDIEIVATAPHRQRFRTSVHADEAKEVRVEIPLLEADAEGGPEESVSRATVAVGLPPLEHPASASSARPIGIASGAVGVAAVGVASYFGLSAISKWNDANNICPQSSCSSPQAVSLSHDAKTAATISDVAFAVGAVALAAGALLFVLGAPQPASARGPNLTIAF
jgi:hypothetical protein